MADRFEALAKIETVIDAAEAVGATFITQARTAEDQTAAAQILAQCATARANLAVADALHGLYDLIDHGLDEWRATR